MRLRAISVLFLASAAIASALSAASGPAPDDVAAPPADAEKTASGLASKVLTPGKGTTHPARTDLVTVHYSGWTTDGKNFDSSLSGGKPVTFPLDKVIAGWTEGVQLMVAGEKRRFWIPEELAYKGKEGRPAGNAGVRRRADFVQAGRSERNVRRSDQGAGRRATGARRRETHRHGTQLQDSQTRHGRAAPRGDQLSHRELFRLDDRREIVRQHLRARTNRRRSG